VLAAVVVAVTVAVGDIALDLRRRCSPWLRVAGLWGERRSHRRSRRASHGAL